MELTEVTGRDNVALIANFTIVARDPQTQKAAQVNPLIPQTEEEKHLYALGEAHAAEQKKQRMLQQQNSSYIPGVDNERLNKLLTEVYLRYPPFCSVLMMTCSVCVLLPLNFACDFALRRYSSSTVGFGLLAYTPAV